MIILKVELHSARTGQVTELGRVHIVNDGTGTDKLGNYDVRAGRKGQDDVDIAFKPQRKGKVAKHARKAKPIWTLVRKALESMGY